MPHRALSCGGVRSVGAPVTCSSRGAETSLWSVGILATSLTYGITQHDIFSSVLAFVMQRAKMVPSFGWTCVHQSIQARESNNFQVTLAAPVPCCSLGDCPCVFTIAFSIRPFSFDFHIFFSFHWWVFFSLSPYSHISVICPCLSILVLTSILVGTGTVLLWPSLLPLGRFVSKSIMEVVSKSLAVCFSLPPSSHLHLTMVLRCQTAPLLRGGLPQLLPNSPQCRQWRPRCLTTVG